MQNEQQQQSNSAVEHALEQAEQGMRVVFVAQYVTVLLASLAVILTIAIRDAEAAEYYDPVAYPTEKPGCFVYPLDQPNADDHIAQLLEDGYVGDPADSKEALYSPDCFGDCPDDAYAVNDLSDEDRYRVERICGLPEAPEGYRWSIDDYSLIPE